MNVHRSPKAQHDMPYIKQVSCQLSNTAQPMEIDLTPAQGEPFRHLVISGPNRSGKTRLLRELVQVLHRLTDPRSPMPSLTAADALKIERTRLRFSDPVRDMVTKFAQGTWLTAYLPVGRALRLQFVQGPARIDSGPTLASKNLVGQFRQFLVNQHAEMAFAIADGDEVGRQRIHAWFEAFTDMLSELCSVQTLTMQFARNTCEFEFRAPGEEPFTLGQFGGGHQSALAIIANLYIRQAQCQQQTRDYQTTPSGVVIVDEVDEHLDRQTACRIIPLLTRHFPRLQFLVSSLSDQSTLADNPQFVLHETKSLSEEAP